MEQNTLIIGFVVLLIAIAGLQVYQINQLSTKLEALGTGSGVQFISSPTSGNSLPGQVGGC